MWKYSSISSSISIFFALCLCRYEYIQRLGNYNHDNVCALKTKCNAFTQRGMYEKVPAVDSTSFYRNGTDAVCANYSTCPDGQYRWFPGVCVCVCVQPCVIRDGALYLCCERKCNRTNYELAAFQDAD